MRHALLMLLLAAVLAPGWAQTTGPLSGFVTLIAERGMFYINRGARDQVNPGALFDVYCNGAVIARAQVIKVSFLDSIAQLVPENRNLLVASGMPVVMRENGATACRTSYECRLPGSDLPWMEPDMSQRREQTELGIIVLAILVGSIVD
jgi:hypothetical protein